MSKTISQPTINPTNKLTATVLGASLAALAKAYLTNRFPYLGDPIIWEPLPIVVGALCGYLVKDKPNVEVAK
jgi:hypothetical protein